MYETKRLMVDDQAAMMATLIRLRARRARQEADEREAVQVARDCCLPDEMIAEALGVVRNTLRYRYGSRRDAAVPRGVRVVEDRLYVTTVPAQRPATS